MPFPRNCGFRRRLLGQAFKGVTPFQQTTRTYLDPCKHNVPENIKWQWAVKDNPDIDCKYACVSKHCPKPSFFPRFSKRFVPKQLKSCEEEKKPMTWGEYFSYLLPDSMQEEQKILGQCKELAKIKSMRPPRTVGSTCGGQSNECAVRAPMEMTAQSTRKTSESFYTKEPKPCPPPESIAPRCVLVQQGICPQQKKHLDMSQYVAPLPYEEIRIGFARPKSEPQVFSQKCTRKCQPSLPSLLGKGTKLSCRYYAEFKTVECPKSMFTRFKSGPPQGPPCPNKNVGLNVYNTTTNLEKSLLSPGIKKGSCAPNLTCRGIHTSSNPMNSSNETDFTKERLNYLQPSKTTLNLKEKALKLEGSNNADARNMGFLKFLSGQKAHELGEGELSMVVTDPMWKGAERESTINRVFEALNRSNRANPSQGGKREEGKEVAEEGQVSLTKGGSSLNKSTPFVSTTRGMATFTRHSSRRLQKKKDCEVTDEEPPPKPICAGCTGVREALRPKKPIDIVKRVIDCRQRPQGTCPGPQRKVYPDEPPPNNPYWRNKATTFSLCNKPRQKPCRKPPKWEGACKDREEYHTAAAPLPPTLLNNNPPPSSQQRYSTITINYLLSRSRRVNSVTITTGKWAQGEKGEEVGKSGQGGEAQPPPPKEDSGGAKEPPPEKEETIYKKFDPHTVKRESCKKKGSPPPPAADADDCAPSDGKGNKKTE